MHSLSDLSLAILALVAGGWLAVALVFSLRARKLASDAAGERRQLTGLRELTASAPVLPLVIGKGGSLEGGALENGGRLLGWIGLDRMPRNAEALFAADGPFGPTGGPMLADRVAAAARAGAHRTVVLSPEGSARILRFDIAPAPASYQLGAVVAWVSDVTEVEQRADEDAHELSRARAAIEALTGLIEAAPFPIWHRGGLGGDELKLVVVNSAYVMAVEAESANEVIAAQIELVDEAEGRNAMAEAGEVLRSHEAAHRTVPATIAGERRMMQIVEVPLGDAGVAGFAIDMEEEEQARAELARFQRAQRDMLDRLSAGVAQFGRDRVLTFFNQPFARLFGLSAETLADRPEFDRVIDAMREARKLPETRDFPSWRTARRAWFTSGESAQEEDWGLPDGRHLRVVAQPLPDGGLVAIFEDRTRQVMLETDRQRMVQVQSTTFDNLVEGIAVFSAAQRLKLFNDRFRHLWGLDPAKLDDQFSVEAMAATLAPLMRGRRHAMIARDLVRAAIVSRRPQAARVALTDGREFDLRAIPIPVDDVLFTTLDVTDSARVETVLRERNSALEEADRVKTAFVSNISYELRTPLTSIAGFAEMLDGGYGGRLPHTARDYVTAIMTSVARLSAMIDDILDLTQSDTGGLLLAEDEIDIAELAEQAVAALGDMAGASAVQLELVADAGSGHVTGDRRRLSQAIQNLVRNAIQHSPSGAGVRVIATGDEEAALIQVEDRGEGIPTAERTRIFDRFQRSGADSAGRGGAGLGLPLALQFVEAHGGTLTVESEVGQGSRFTISLPRTADQRAAFADRGAAPAS